MYLKFKPRELYLHFFTIINVLGLLACFINIKLGIISSALILVLFFQNYKSFLGSYDFVFSLYLFFSIISVISYLWNSRPIVIFFAAISFNFIPSLLYYIGKKAKIDNNIDLFIENMLNAFIIMMLIGTIAYLLFPNIYYQYLGASIESYTYGLEEYRYGSYISSLALGSIGTISIILYFYIFDNLEIWKKTTYLPLIVINVIMCMQRSAWITSAISLIICAFVKFKKNKKARMNIIVVIGIFALLVIIGFNYKEHIFTRTQLVYFENRIKTIEFNGMASSRSSQWIDAWKTFVNNPILGLGLGACGQKAAPYGLEIVTDGNHMRILSEIGIIGFGAFIYINIRGIIKSLKEKNYYLAIAIIACNVAAIGSPIFDQYYASFAYWLLLGCTNEK